MTGQDHKKLSYELSVRLHEQFFIHHVCIAVHADVCPLEKQHIVQVFVPIKAQRNKK